MTADGERRERVGELIEAAPRADEAARQFGSWEVGQRAVKLLRNARAVDVRQSRRVTPGSGNFQSSDNAAHQAVKAGITGKRCGQRCVRNGRWKLKQPPIPKMKLPSSGPFGRYPNNPFS